MIPEEQQDYASHKQENEADKQPAQRYQPLLTLGERPLHRAGDAYAISPEDGIEPHLVYIMVAVAIGYLVDNDRIAIVVDKNAVVKADAVKPCDGVATDNVFRMVFGHRYVLGLASCKCKQYHADNKKPYILPFHTPICFCIPPRH